MHGGRGGLRSHLALRPSHRARARPGEAIFDGWTILGAVAENTKRPRIGLNVTGNLYRHPGLLAKIAVTVDHLSGGRLEMGIGAAWNEPEFTMYGLSFPSVADRIRMLDEACRVLKALWTEERDVHGPKRTLRVVAKHADVWSSNAPTPEATHALVKVLDEHCAKVGRDRSAARIRSAPRRTTRFGEAALRAGFTELLLFPFAGGDLRSGVERAAALLPGMRALAR